MTKLTFLGHASWKIEHNGKTILIDPFITGNPVAKVKAEDLCADAIIVTHGHQDHFGDTASIAKRCNSLVISTNEVAVHASKLGLKAHPLHIGGSHKFDFGKVKLTIAHHASAFGENLEFWGNPAGVLLYLDDKVIYHSGDTGLFYDMKLIGELNRIDVALLPIGDNFTMGVEDAIYAAKLLKPKVAIPMHYNTWDVINADPQDFAKGLKDSGIEVVILKVGESYEI